MKTRSVSILLLRLKNWMHLFLRNNIKSDFVTFSCLFGISFILFQYHIDYDSFSFIILIIILYKPIYYSFSDSKKKPYFGSTKNLPFSVIFFLQCQQLALKRIWRNTCLNCIVVSFLIKLLILSFYRLFLIWLLVWMLRIFSIVYHSLFITLRNLLVNFVPR